MHVRSLGFQTDLALLRMGGAEVEDHGDHLIVRSPHNPSYWWGNFVLLAAVPPSGGASTWIDRFHDAFPAAAHVALGFDGTQGTVADLAEFAALGFSAEAQTVMTAERVRAPAHRSHDAELRTLASDDDWAQSVELRLRCVDRNLDLAGYRTFTTAKARTNRSMVDAGHGAWFGAFVDGTLVCQMGLVLAAPGLARFQSVETDPAHRRQGLAGSLVWFTSREGAERLGARRFVMVADPTYFAIDLYRAVGFHATQTQLQIERPPA